MKEPAPFPPPLVLTLKLDAIAFDVLNQLRQQHFPPNRNFLPAHITLFHALPGDQKTAIQQTLQSICEHTAKLPLQLPKLRFLGKGIAVEVDAPELVQLQNQLAERWSRWLTAQDRQRYRPHVTLQNKVAPEAARQLYNQLASTWEPLKGQGEGLLLWHYQGGPWEAAGEFIFGRSSGKSVE